MMKTRLTVVFLLVVCMLMVSVCFAEEGENDLHYDRYFITLPTMSLRADPNTPGEIDVVYAGQEVDVIDIDGIWAVFTYVKDGETRTGCTWVAALSPAVRIHLLEDEFIYRLPYDDREDFGSISCWREPTDPDLLILWEEVSVDGARWYYVVSLEDCRSGYMRQEASFELVE